MRDGIVIVQEASTPETYREWVWDQGPHDRQSANAWAIHAEMPPLKDWEDLLFITWEMAKTMAANDGKPSQLDAPRWLIIQDSWGGDAVLRIVRACLQRRGFRRNNIPKFPGQIFFAGHWCFNALLQTEQSKRFVWLLALHKQRWNFKTLTSVRVFLGNRPGAALPSLVWEVEHGSHANHAKVDFEFQKGLGAP